MGNQMQMCEGFRCFGESCTLVQVVHCHFTRSTVSPPLYSEVFDEFPDTFVNIDLKGADPDGVMLRQVHDLIVARRRERLTCWGSFNDKTVQACYNGEQRQPADLIE